MLLYLQTQRPLQPLVWRLCPLNIILAPHCDKLGLSQDLPLFTVFCSVALPSLHQDRGLFFHSLDAENARAWLWLESSGNDIMPLEDLALPVLPFGSKPL